MSHRINFKNEQNSKRILSLNQNPNWDAKLVILSYFT